MRFALIFLTAALLSACATQARPARCDDHLVPINPAPASEGASDAARPGR